MFCLCFCLRVLEGYFLRLDVAFLVAGGFSPEQINKFLLSITLSAFESLFNVHNSNSFDRKNVNSFDKFWSWNNLQRNLYFEKVIYIDEFKGIDIRNG